MSAQYSISGENVSSGVAWREIINEINVAVWQPAAKANQWRKRILIN